MDGGRSQDIHGDFRHRTSHPSPPGRPMFRPYLIIDGYNLMHAAGLARTTYGPGQLERLRMRLLRHLARHLTAAERERTTIVFDAGTAPPDLPRQSMTAGIAVRFASPGREADDEIEELIAAHSAPRQIRLVSSDHRLQRSVRRRGGTFLDSEDFAREIERRGPVAEAAPPPPKPDPRSASSADPAIETRRWLEIFGDVLESPEIAAASEPPERALDEIDVAAIQAEIDRQDAGDPRAPKRPTGKNAKQRPAD